MHHYKVYYQYYKYGSLCLGNMEYSSKLQSNSYQFFRELEECIKLTVDAEEVIPLAIHEVKSTIPVKKKKQEVSV